MRNVVSCKDYGTNSIISTSLSSIRIFFLGRPRCELFSLDKRKYVAMRQNKPLRVVFRSRRLQHRD